MPRDKYLVKMSEDDWDLVMNVMLKGAFLATKAVMPQMIEQGGAASSTSARARTWATRRRPTTRPPRRA
jgi:3-oxoacyl-[acyl-carrier protein] reductase